MEIKRVGTQASTVPPSSYLTGAVRVDPLYEASTPSRLHSVQVTFEPGARTAWHMHPVGQLLIVTAGSGWAQTESGPIEEIRSGDIVVRTRRETLARRRAHHRHDPYRHSRELDESAITWMDKVSDDEYSK
ncbi:cupin domain-containing protein [Granulicella sp. dw_53]|uniref:cupin domain-containing protein n=1 Tax=Granulicella sp. dw_53 TaxID=2719792 RepID=UPI0031F61D55